MIKSYNKSGYLVNQINDLIKIIKQIKYVW